MPRTPDCHPAARALLAAATALAVTAAAAADPTAPPAFAASSLTLPGVRAMASGCATCHGTDGHPAPGQAVPGAGGASSAMNEAEAQYAMNRARNIRADALA